MSPIFEAIPDSEEAKSVKQTAQVVTEPLQVIPEEEELDLNLKPNTSRQLLEPSKSEHPLARHATLSTLGTHYPFPKPSRNEFQSEHLFSSTQFGKVGKKPDPSVRKRERIITEY